MQELLTADLKTYPLGPHTSAWLKLEPVVGNRAFSQAGPKSLQRIKEYLREELEKQTTRTGKSRSYS